MLYFDHLALLKIYTTIGALYIFKSGVKCIFKNVANFLLARTEMLKKNVENKSH